MSWDVLSVDKGVLLEGWQTDRSSALITSLCLNMFGSISVHMVTPYDLHNLLSGLSVWLLPRIGEGPHVVGLGKWQSSFEAGLILGFFHLLPHGPPTCCGPGTPQFKPPGNFIRGDKSAFWEILQIPDSLWPYLAWMASRLFSGSESLALLPVRDGTRETAWVPVGVRALGKELDASFCLA